MHGRQANSKMVRKTCCALLPFQAGLLAAFLSGNAALLGVPFILGAALVIFAFFKSARAYAAVISVSFCLGTAASCVYTLAVYDDTVAFDGQSVSVKGYVYDKSEYDGGRYVITVKGRINEQTDAKLSFYIEREEYDRLTYGDGVTVYGDVYKITDSIIYQSESSNKANGIFLRGKKAERTVKEGINRHPLFRAARELRDSAYDTLCAYGGEGGKYLGAILCGEKGDIDSAVSEEMYRAGIGHIFAFSGTHIAIIISLASIALETLSIGRRTNSLLLLLITWGLVLFSGLAVSAIRAAVMMSVLLLSKLSKQRSDPLTSLSIAGFLITAVSPYSVGSYSFMLSFLGSFACSAYADILGERMHTDKPYPPVGMKRNIIAVFCVGLLQMPVNSLLFGEVSVIAPVTNLLMIPVCSFCLMLSITGLIAGLMSPVISGGIIWFASVIMKGCVTITGTLSRLPFASVNTCHPALKAVMIVISVLPAVIMLLSYRKNMLFILYAVSAALMIGVSSAVKYSQRDKLYIIAYSTGYGESILVYDSESAVFITNEGSLSFNVLERLCLKRGVPRLGGIVYDGAVPDIALLTDSETVTCSDSFESEALGSFELSYDKIIFAYEGSGVVTFEKKLYNNIDGYEYELEDGCVETELDRKALKAKVRRLDNGFDITV